MQRDLAFYLSTLSSEFRHISCSQEILDEAKKRVLDSWACFSQGYYERSVTRLRCSLIDLSKGPCLVWGTNIRVSPEIAVLLNGAAVRALDYNDTYLSKEPCHPSDLLAALWAACELSGERYQGRLLLRALILGYEIMCRLCDSASLRIRGWDHVTYLPIASAVACSTILNLNKQQTRNAIAMALTSSIALRQTRVGEISDWKAVCAANATRSGLLAAISARNGLTGPSDIFVGRHGFVEQVSKDMSFSRTPLGESWGILRTHIKYFPAEHHAQSAIEAAIQIRSQLASVYRKPGFLNAAVKKIVIDTFDVAVSIIGSEKEKWNPSTRETADHSLPYLVCVALTEGTVSIEQYRAERFKNATLRRLLKKVQVQSSEVFTRSYPKNMPSSVTVVLTNGNKISQTVYKPLGYAGRPMSFADVEAKLVCLGSAYRESTHQTKLIEKVKSMEDIHLLASFERELFLRGSRGK